MRKLLMATAAMVGASLGMANASQIELATPTGLTRLPWTMYRACAAGAVAGGSAARADRGPHRFA